MTADPHASYAARLAAREAEAARLEVAADRLGRLRITLIVVAAVAANVGQFSGLFPWWWAVAVVVPLFVLFLRSKVLTGRRNRVRRGVRFYRDGLDRLAGEWVGRGPDGTRFLDPAHPYAADLDLFGRGGLFQRLTVARTADGEALLAAWLLGPAAADEVKSRQGAVADLRDRLDLREYLAAAGADVRESADFTGLAAWAAEPCRNVPRWRRTLVGVLGMANVFALAGALGFGLSSGVVLVSAVASLWAVWPLDRWARRMVVPVDAAAGELPLLEGILLRLEAEAFACPRLKAVQAALFAAGVRPSSQVKELRVLADWLASRRNPLFVPIAVVTLWDVQMACKFDEWRRRSGPAVARWLAAVAELEALGSLAGYAFENPGDPFPDVHDGPPAFRAAGIAHPLLRGKGVRNDAAVGGDGPSLLVVSGSNMSGKSTLLRAVGANAVLALAGGPVRATTLALSPVALGATMRVQDSLHDGKSRFYAEVTRVRAVLDLAAKQPPVLFLFDELFAGTNSSDRQLGAEAVLRALLDAGAIGLVTTHDLALTAAVDSLGGRAANVHFADQLVNGEMHFDYTMRPGVVPHGNGVALMRAVGLDV